MSIKFSFFQTHFFFLYRFLFRQSRVILRGLQKYNVGNSNIHSNSSTDNTQCKYQRFSSLVQRSDDLSEKTLIFSVEGALLKSSSLFPYFFLVAFEAGSFVRAFILLMLYPLICLVGKEMGLKVMVMVCLLGIKKEGFREGRAVLPKVFLEDVGMEPFLVLRRGGKRVAISNLPQVMIESFLKDYLEIECVNGRELKVVGGYFIGLMEDKKEISNQYANNLIVVVPFGKSIDKDFLPSRKEIYWVGSSDKRSWKSLPKEKYPNPLIFHDGRVAIRPTPSAALTLLIWMSFGFILSIFRILFSLSLPLKLSTPILAFTGLKLSVHPNSNPVKPAQKPRKGGILYISNHRTLVDPLYIMFSIQKNLTAVTYSLSRMSEIIAPIKTVRLTRNRQTDAKILEKLLDRGDVVVCPEGTTCREPFLLRFSPMFAEMSDVIVPVAIDARVDMFYGTTAGGLKSLDPFFLLMNPRPSYTVRILDAIDGCRTDTCRDGNRLSRYDVANSVQGQIGEVLGFECTGFTRKDKYLILAGNEGISGD